MWVKITNGRSRWSTWTSDPRHFAIVVTGRGGRFRASIASQDTILHRGKDTTMGFAWHEDSVRYRPAAQWAGLLALVLAAACGGDREAAPPAGEGTVAAVDTTAAPATPAPTDTAAPGGVKSATTDTTGSRGDTTGRNRPSPEAATQPSKPAAAPAPKPAPKPAAEKPSPDTTTTATQAPPQPAPAAQDSPPAAQGGGDQPLRDAYHQAPRDTVDQVTYNGWKQYNLNCARCHGEDVLGTTIAPHLILSLKPDGPINTKELFLQTVCAGRPEKGMPSWCALGMDPAKINEIYAYVHGRSEGKLGPGRPALKEGS
jgi:hypothetical protein